MHNSWSGGLLVLPVLLTDEDGCACGQLLWTNLRSPDCAHAVLSAPLDDDYNCYYLHSRNMSKDGKYIFVLVLGFMGGSPCRDAIQDLRGSADVSLTFRKQVKFQTTPEK